MAHHHRSYPKYSRRPVSVGYPRSHTTRPRGALAFSTFGSSRQSLPTVKIENLSKQTSEEDLVDRLQSFDEHISSVHVVECSGFSANYAYVNCTDSKTAHRIISEVDNKMLLHSNLLTARLKVDSTRQAYQEISRAPSKDIGAVKVLISEGGFLTGQHLDVYFARYGELSSPCVIRLGSPNYAYINFKDPSVAVRVRSESKHVVEGVRVTAANFKSRNETSGAANSCGTGLEFVNMKYDCDPLAVKYVQLEVTRCLNERKESKVKLTTHANEVCVYAEKSISGWAGDLVKRSVEKHEAEIGSVQEPLACYYLPILADPAVQKKFADMQVPFEVNIQESSRAGLPSTYVPLTELSQAYGRCKEKNTKDDGLKHYLLPSKKTATRYEWFWKDDSGFMPYDASTSKKLDRALTSKLTIVESIGRFDYKIDPMRMEQTNTRTGKVRRIRRTAVDVEESRNISVQIRAHSNHLQEVKRELFVEMDGAVVERSYKVPYLDNGTNVADLLLEVARQGFVSAEKLDSGCILLKGIGDIVTSTELRLKEKELSLKIAQTESSKQSVPSFWEPQDSKCVVVDVTERSAEWNEIKRHMTEPSFRVEIVRIERIQNLWLWEVYNTSRKRMSDKNKGTINEKRLFHGTRTTPPKKIYNSEQGFDNRLSSRGLWGEGAYFAVKASYSNSYAYTTPEGYSQMFLVQVITGITCKLPQKRDLKAPPKKADHPAACGVSRGSMFEDERFDSVSGDTNGSEIFVIYEHGKVYPAYLITYKRT